MFQKVKKWIKNTVYWNARKKNTKAILRDFEIAYEIQKGVYEYDCMQRNFLMIKNGSKLSRLNLKPEVILHFELSFSMSELELFRKIDLDIDKVIKQFEEREWESFIVFKEYTCARFEQKTKEIAVGDRVLKYHFYSQKHRRKYGRTEEFLKDNEENKIINFYDYLEEKNKRSVF